MAYKFARKCNNEKKKTRMMRLRSQKYLNSNGSDLQLNVALISLFHKNRIETSIQIRNKVYFNYF